MVPHVRSFGCLVHATAVPATLTGYYTHSHGRSFWRWFLLGCGLPFLSLLVVAVVVHQGHRRHHRLPQPAAQEKPQG